MEEDLPEQIHEGLNKLSITFKDSINELLREIDIGNPSGIKVPSYTLINLDTATKIYKILRALINIDDVVGQPGLPCPVQSQRTIQLVRKISLEPETKEENMDFIRDDNDKRSQQSTQKAQSSN